MGERGDAIAIAADAAVGATRDCLATFAETAAGGTAGGRLAMLPAVHTKDD
jgi:hypothetical protein